ncbi:DUF58 domain-containing protein [Aquibacillus albus]|uniref:Uncharacterized protein (DUF58 family) n=1 Tax=Aquibacillus albus TaxID=1168171 RepID=A0ABS2N3R6_9BACI|nr:DUF58 domain-containing protein [Aquibacillus albus]MBM7572773.1 uncharacterized protein (DUF58 family) [Aquibacillus albus]
MALKYLFVVILFGVFYSYAMFQGGFVSWFLFYSFLPLVIYMFLLLAYPISNWHVSRSLSKQVVQAGDQVKIELEINRKFGFPLYYLVVEEFFPSSLQQKHVTRKNYQFLNEPQALTLKRQVKKVTFPWFKRTIRFQYSLTDLPRGEHRLRALRVKTGDFFGFIKKEYVYEVNNYILVYPPKRKVLVKEKVNSFDEGASPTFQVNMKNSNIVSGIREYMPGDRFSWIDWKATARKNTVMTKEFEQEKSSSMLLLLDATDYQGINKIGFEASVELTCSILESYRKRTAQLAFISLGEEQVFFPLNQNPGKDSLIMSFLATVQPGGNTAFPQLLMEQSKRIPNGLVIMLVTTNVSQSVKQSIDQLRQKSKRVMIYLIKPKNQLLDADNRLIQQMKVEGTQVNVLTEEQLIKQEFEVNM